jgi:hypothetical protein
MDGAGDAGGVMVGGDGGLVTGGGDGGVTVSFGGPDVPAQATAKTKKHNDPWRSNDLVFKNLSGEVIIGSCLRALEGFDGQIRKFQFADYFSRHSNHPVIALGCR